MEPCDNQISSGPFGVSNLDGLFDYLSSEKLAFFLQQKLQPAINFPDFENEKPKRYYMRCVCKFKCACGVQKNLY